MWFLESIFPPVVAAQNIDPQLAALRTDLSAMQRTYAAAQLRVASDVGSDVALLFSLRLREDKEAIEQADQLSVGIHACRLE